MWVRKPARATRLASRWASRPARFTELSAPTEWHQKTVKARPNNDYGARLCKRSVGDADYKEVEVEVEALGGFTV
jgi:hypothetical protein